MKADLKATMDAHQAQIERIEAAIASKSDLEAIFSRLSSIEQRLANLEAKPEPQVSADASLAEEHNDPHISEAAPSEESHG